MSLMAKETGDGGGWEEGLTAATRRVRADRGEGCGGRGHRKENMHAIHPLPRAGTCARQECGGEEGDERGYERLCEWRMGKGPQELGVSLLRSHSAAETWLYLA